MLSLFEAEFHLIDEDLRVPEHFIFYGILESSIISLLQETDQVTDYLSLLARQQVTWKQTINEKHFTYSIQFLLI